MQDGQFQQGDPFLLGLDDPNKKNGKPSAKKESAPAPEADPYLLGLAPKKKDETPATTGENLTASGETTPSSVLPLKSPSAKKENEYPLLYPRQKGQMMADLRPQIHIEKTLDKVSFGDVTGKDLKDLYDKPYGKDVVDKLGEEYGPAEKGYQAVGITPVNFEPLAKAINISNRINAVEAQSRQMQRLDEEINDAVNNYQAGNVYVGGGTGGAAASVSVRPLEKIDNSDLSSYGRLIEQLSTAAMVTDKDGKSVNKDQLIKDITTRLYFIKQHEPINEEINQLTPKITAAVTKSNLDRERGEELKTEDVLNDKTNIDHFKAGLNFVKDVNPGKYKNVVRALNDKEQIADNDFRDIARIGQDVVNLKTFSDAAFNPELIGKETDLDYTTYQDKKSIYAGQIGEYLKNKGYTNYRQFPKKVIQQAAKTLGLPNQSIVNDLAEEEQLLGYDAIPKSGWRSSVVRGFMQPLSAITQTVQDIAGTPTENYLRSQQFDVGQGQQVASKKGNMGLSLGSDRGNLWYDALEGFGQFIPQVLLTKGIGKPLAGVLGADARVVLTANQLKNIETYGGTFISTYLQEYGNAYEQGLATTGDPRTAKAMGAINGTSAALFELILPDTEIADRATKILKKGNFAESIIDVIKEGGDPAALAKKGHAVVNKFVRSSLNIAGQEVSEEVGTQIVNYITEAIFSPKTVTNRDLGNEILNTAKATAVQMAIPAVLGAGGQAPKAFSVNGLHSAAVNFEEYKSALNQAKINNVINDDEYNVAIKLLSTHRQSLADAPLENNNGKLLTQSQRHEYAYQETIAKVNAEKQKSTTSEITKQALQNKIDKAQEVQRRILGLPRPELKEGEVPVTPDEDYKERIVANESLVAREPVAEEEKFTPEMRPASMDVMGNLINPNDVFPEGAATPITQTAQASEEAVPETEKAVQDMSVDELEKESAMFDQKIKKERDRLDKLDPNRQIIGGAGIQHLSDADVQRMTSVNDELGRRTSISSEEARQRRQEKRKQRLAQAEQQKVTQPVKLSDNHREELIHAVDNRIDTITDDPASATDFESQESLKSLKEKFETGNDNFTPEELGWVKEEVDELIERTRSAQDDPEVKKKATADLAQLSKLKSTIETAIAAKTPKENVVAPSKSISGDIFNALTRKSKAGQEMALKRLGEVDVDKVALARKINDNFDSIVEKLVANKKINKVCP